MCMKKIIFLDFDGVLNTEYNQNLLMFMGNHGKTSMELSSIWRQWLN